MKRRAFTLVELMVVIAVVALLMAMVVPSMSSVFALSRAKICQNNLKRLSDAFSASSSGRVLMRAGAGGVRQVLETFPKPMAWPTVPMDAVPDPVIYKCPEDEVKEGGAVNDMFKLLEYVNPFGRFPMNTLGGESFYYISRTGEDSRGSYTEYCLQDDNGNGQFALMDFNGWIDTDGFVRVYHSGEIFVPASVPTTGDFSGVHGPAVSNGFNTCGDKNLIYFRGKPAFGSEGRLKDHRGQYFQLEDWSIGEGTNYGINSYASKYPFGAKCIVLVDYKEEIIVEVDTPLEAEELLLKSGRHLGKANYLWGDGSVRNATPMDLSPRLYPELWTPQYMGHSVR
jgi:prepilin-type N-terminal cleavage/methylation domain-containing protein/prepilin-type processing-associated H-X9-DG protein